MRVVVSNTGPVLHLWETNGLDLLAAAGRVLISTEVLKELARHEITGLPGRLGWLEVEDPPEQQLELLRPWVESGIIHGGEASALALALHQQATWFLTDDTAARLVGSALGLEVHGSLGIVLWAAASGIVDHTRSRQLLEALLRSSLWISPRVAAAAREALATIIGSSAS